MATAYLVIHMDTSTTPPTVTAAGIYSEGVMSLSGAIGPNACAATIMELTRKSFSLAKRELLHNITEYPFFKWLRQFKRIQHDLEEVARAT